MSEFELFCEVSVEKWGCPFAIERSSGCVERLMISIFCIHFGLEWEE